MKKKAKLTILIFLLLFVNSFFFVQVCEGNNPESWFNITPVPVPEGTGSVLISVDSPKNYSSFKTNNITLSFTVSSPDPLPTPNVVNNYVSLDIWSDWTDVVPIIPVYGAGENAAIRANMSISSRSGLDYNPSVIVNIQNIPEGFHNLTIKYSRIYYTMYSAEPYDINGTCYRLESSSTIYFSVSSNATNSSTDVFQGQVTPIPTSTLTLPPEDRNAPHLDPIFYVIPVSLIVAVILLSVLLYRRTRKTSNLKQ